jgi:integrase
MLTIYRRHLEDIPGDPPIERCKSKLKKRGLSIREIRTWKRCDCPLWIIGTDPRGAYHRHTLDTASWASAEEKKRKIEAGIEERVRVLISKALDDWTDALLAAKRKQTTVRAVHGAMAKTLKDWSAHAGYEYLDELTLSVLDKFVGSWDYASTTHRGRIDLMRSFFRFCLNRKWIKENPASGLIKPEEDLEPTLPFTADEEKLIFAAAERFLERPNFNGLWVRYAQTAIALLYVMRWTGLRATDAVLFEPRKIQTVTVDGTEVAVYETYQMKTGKWVMCPIPPHVAALIRSAPRLSEEHAFIPAADAGYMTEPRRVSNNFYTGFLCPLATLSGVPEVRAHRFRDTFAVRLLEQGKPLEIVQALLGHKSIRTTEKHYAPWVKSRQEMLVREVMRTW